MYTPDRMTGSNVILYVEDDEISRKSLGLIIKRKYPDFRLVLAVNGREGLEMYKLEKPALVITDIIMPVMDGMQMIKEIRAISPDVGIIVTSASCDFESFTNVVDLDSRYYLCKPININKLFEVVDELLAGQFMVRENDCSALAG